MNNTLLIFFAIPIAVIIVSIALQKIFKCPFLVSAIIFAIFLVATFIIGNLVYLVATIAYTILSFVTAIITQTICRIQNELERRNNNNENTTYSCGCNTSNNSIAVSANVFPNSNTNGRSGRFCGCFRRR